MKKSIEDLAREERLNYFKEWRAKNKSKVRANNQRYWEKKAREKLDREEGEKNEWCFPDSRNVELKAG